jgi:hypothetical protein
MAACLILIEFGKFAVDRAASEFGLPTSGFGTNRDQLGTPKSASSNGVSGRFQFRPCRSARLIPLAAQLQFSRRTDLQYLAAIQAQRSSSMRLSFAGQHGASKWPTKPHRRDALIQAEPFNLFCQVLTNVKRDHPICCWFGKLNRSRINDTH